MSAPACPSRPTQRPVLEVRTQASGPAGERLVGFALEDGAAGCPLPRLAGSPGGEVWQAARAGAFRIETLHLVPADDIEAAAEQAYATLLRRVRGSAQPYLLRIWNFFDGINAGEGDAERYRAFCIGRARAVDADFHAPPPAATAIGTPPGGARGLQVVALCGARPGVALENPRQTPAWRYPREYGPVAPGFSRGAVLGEGEQAVLLASGTASIVGHVSRHVGDVEAQLEESLRNLEALLAEGQARCGTRFSLSRCHGLRAYLRHPRDAATVLARLQARLGAEVPVRLLHGEICRRELDVELEGVFGSD